jgi:hypothetical protein
MCEECDRVRALPLDEVVATSAARANAVFAAVSEPSDGGLVEMSTQDAMFAALAALTGVSRDMWHRLALDVTERAAALFQADVPMSDILDGSALQAWALGWCMRDEQMRAIHAGPSEDEIAREQEIVEASGMCEPERGPGTSLVEEAAARQNARMDAASGRALVQGRTVTHEQRAASCVGLDYSPENGRRVLGAMVPHVWAKVEEAAMARDGERVANVLLSALEQTMILGMLHEQVRVERERAQV